MKDNITIENMQDNITIEDMEDNITIEDMKDDLKPILKREPDFDVIHVGVNNANNIITSEISNKLHLCFFKATLLFKSASVLLNFFMN